MKKCVRLICKLCLAATIALACGSWATAAQVKNAQNEPFKIGEKLVYLVELSRLFLRGADVSDLTFQITATEPAAPDKIQFKAEAESKGVLLKLFSFSFLQKFDSTVHTSDYRILRTVRYDKQNERVRASEANFDYKRKMVIYREIDPKNAARPPRLISSALDAPVQDLVSAIYFLRRQPLAVGQDLNLKLSDSGLIYDIPVKITARERIKTVLGKVWTLRIEPELFGARRPLGGEGKITVWLTDDNRRLPVRSQVNASIGKIDIKLKQAENLQPVK
jgi:hypothetical protein